MKKFRVSHNVGKAKFVISHHDGVKQHPDGSPFFDVDICNQKKAFESKLKELRSQGYREVH